MIGLKLQCREFMEMVKNVKYDSIYVDSQLSEEDEYKMQLLEVSERVLSEGSSKRRVSTIDSKDVNCRKKKLKISNKQKQDTFNDILEYGHKLKSQYEEASRTNETIKSELTVKLILQVLFVILTNFTIGRFFNFGIHRFE